MHLEQTVAYALLTIACCSGAAAAYFLFDLEDYFHLTGLLLGALAANLGRRLLAPVNEANLVALSADRVLFFVWPAGVLVLLCATFNRKLVLRFVVAPAFALLVGAIVSAPELFNEAFLRCIGQVVAGATGLFALVLVLLRGKRPAFLSPLELAALFCGVSEGLVALVGYLDADAWWPAISVYCVLYLALVSLHGRVLWSLRRPPTSLNSQPT